jgi:transposase
MNVNCYPLIFKQRVVKCYYSKQLFIKDLLDLFKISRSSLYNWVKLHKTNNLCEKKLYRKKSKYSNDIKKYIIKYVVKKINFDYKKLILIIKN